MYVNVGCRWVMDKEIIKNIILASFASTLSFTLFLYSIFLGLGLSAKSTHQIETCEHCLLVFTMIFYFFIHSTLSYSSSKM